MNNDFKLNSNTSFTFSCKLCGNCCKEMLIRLTPFDILNLAAGLNLPTYDFIEDYVVFLKAPNIPWFIAALKHVKKGECLFRQGKKCKVHPYRPLPCRLFPVGRTDEGFILQKTAYCKGHNSNQEYNLADWLKEAGADPYLKMSQEYYQFMLKIADKYDLEKLGSKKSKMFYKLLFDFDSASLESTISLSQEEDKVRFCFQMAEWFLEYTSEQELSDQEFLNVYEKQALLVEKS